MADSLCDLDALTLRDRLAAGAVRAVELAEACLARIGEREGEVQAWAWLDSDHVLGQARALDEYRATGRAIGPLHGLPVGIKDVIDTAGIPTENGTVLDAGRVPDRDAYVVARLRQAGAVIMGKTVTTELAFRSPGKTRNPHDPAHTPGGSSSGSAAAVACGMVPLALGTQTGGSVIRPASFCGVVGFKPSFGMIPRTGMALQAPSLDTIGVFARDVAGAALVAEELYGHDAGDDATALIPSPRLLDTARADAPARPALAFVRTAAWDGAAPETHAAFAELTEALGEDCEPVELPAPFADYAAIHRVVHQVEQARCYYRYAARGRDKLSQALRDSMDQGNEILALDYLAARDWQTVFNAGLDEIFERFDAILTPAALGAAPAGLESTGSAVCNALWTFCGTPAVSLPLLAAGNGLPMGAQLVGRKGDDARLLRTARWLVGRLAG